MLRFEIYIPRPHSTTYSQSFTTFTNQLSSFLIIVSTTHEFILTGDFSIYFDDLTDQQSVFLVIAVVLCNIV